MSRRASEFRPICAAARTFLVSVCALLAGAFLPASAQDSPVSIDYDVSYVSKYVWRGLVANPDAAVQPSLTLTSATGLSVNFWGSVDATGIAGAEGEFTEIDYTLNYDFAAGGRDWSAGYILYDFPNTAFDSTSEVYIGTSFGGPYDAGVTLYYDIDQADGFYLSGSASTSIPAGEKSLEVSGSIGLASSNYNAAYFGESKAALVDASVGMSYPLLVRDTWSVTPFAVFTALLDGSLRDAADDPDNLVAGISVSGSF